MATFLADIESENEAMAALGNEVSPSESIAVDVSYAWSRNMPAPFLYIDCTDLASSDSYPSTHGFQALLDYVKTSEALRKVSLPDFLHLYEDLPLFNAAMAVAGSFVRAVAENPSVETLILGILPAPLDFQYLLSTTDSIKTLDMNDLNCDLMDGPVWTQNEQNLVAAAFGTNRTIENLSFGWSLLPTFIDSILVQLRARPWGLNQLKTTRGTLMPDTHQGSYTLTQAESLGKLLLSTPRLQHLGFQYTTIEDNEMPYLIDGLVHRSENAVPSVMIQKLTFDSCDVSKDAMSMLIQFMQTRFSDEDDGRPVIKSRLRELVVDGIMDPCDEEGLGSASCLVAMLAMQPAGTSDGPETVNPPWHATIGSQIHTLSIDFPRILPIFNECFELMAAEASRYTFSRLNVKFLHDEGATGLLKYLSKTLSLRELTIESTCDDLPSLKILRVLRSNQSLYQVSFWRGTYSFDTRKMSIFNRSQLRRVAAYCQRNRELPYLLKNARMLRLTDYNNSSASSRIQAISSLFPSLLQVTMGTRFTLKDISGSLLHAQDALGETVGRKRKRRLSAKRAKKSSTRL